VHLVTPVSFNQLHSRYFGFKLGFKAKHMFIWKTMTQCYEWSGVRVPIKADSAENRLVMVRLLTFVIFVERVVGLIQLKSL